MQQPLWFIHWLEVVSEVGARYCVKKVGFLSNFGKLDRGNFWWAHVSSNQTKAMVADHPPAMLVVDTKQLCPGVSGEYRL